MWSVACSKKFNLYNVCTNMVWIKYLDDFGLRDDVAYYAFMNPHINIFSER